MHILVNAVAATAGGGITYVRNMIPQLASVEGTRVTLLLPAEAQDFEGCPNLQVIKFQASGNVLQRFRREQLEIPKIIRRVGADLLVSAGNFALRKSPVPQILLSRNSLYTSGDFYRDLLNRKHLSIYLDTKSKALLARKSIAWADATVAPSEAFAEELRMFANRNIIAIHHGFDRDRFLTNCQPLSDPVMSKLDEAGDCVRLLLVSHYNYYRNFETVLRGLAELKKSVPGKKFKLFLTCKLRSEQNPGSYQAERAATMVANLGLRQEVVELGAIPHDQLPDLYRQCRIYVTAAYAESFAHPLVEAMASGLPVVASDITVHKEICGTSALFFNRFSASQMAERILQLERSNECYTRLSAAAQLRSMDFSWEKHVRELLKLASSLINRPIWKPPVMSKTA